jgi:hypothetical protein
MLRKLIQTTLIITLMGPTSVIIAQKADTTAAKSKMPDSKSEDQLDFSNPDLILLIEKKVDGGQVKNINNNYKNAFHANYGGRIELVDPHDIEGNPTYSDTVIYRYVLRNAPLENYVITGQRAFLIRIDEIIFNRCK